MQQQPDDEQMASAILSTLCRTDVVPWCIVDPGAGTVMRCSRAFVQVWGGHGAARPQGTAAPGDAQNGFRRVDPGQIDPLLDGIRHGPQGDRTEFCVQAPDGRDYLVTADAISDSPPSREVRVLWMQAVSDENTGSTAPAPMRPELAHEIARAQSRVMALTIRERQILWQLYEGATNKAVAIRRGISIKTVEKHRSRILTKLHLRSTAEMFRLMSTATIDPDFVRAAFLMHDDQDPDQADISE